MASKKEIYKNSLIELRKNTEILEMTFEKSGLQLIQHSWQMMEDTDGWVILYVEVTGDPDKMEDKSVTIKVNMYDADGELLSVKHASIGIEKFSGYETKQISFYEDGLLLKACKARVYAVRS